MKNNTLPPNWSWVKLGDLTRIVYGKGLPTKNLLSSGYPVFGANGVIGFFDRYLYEEEQVLISCRGAYSGKINISPSQSYITNNSLVIEILEANKLFKKYLYFSLINAKKDKLVTGTAQPQVTINNAVELTIPLPPLPEQKKIVEKIEELFSGLDSGVASLKKAKEQIRSYRQSVLSAAFSGGLVKDEKRETKNELETHLNGVQGAAIAAEPKVGYGKDLPEGWKWVKTSDIMELIDNGYTPKAQLMYSGRGDIPFIKVYNLTFNGELDFSKNPIFIDQETHSKNLKRSITIPGDVLINIVGPPLGKVSIVPKTFKEWNINQAIVRFRPNKNITSKYLCYYLQNPKTIQWLESTSRATAGQYNIKVSTCREIPIPLISVKEQHQIVSEIEKRFSEVDNLEKAIDESLAKSDTLRQSILKQAFCGKLIINNEELIIKN